MLALLAQNLAPIMFLALVGVLLLGFPVAFSLAAVGLGFFVVAVALAPLSHCEALSSVCRSIGEPVITLDWHLLDALPERIFGVMSNETLLAIPFFTLMGLVLERSGMAEDLLDTVGQLFGTVRGGLGYAVVLVGALLAATTGVVAASVISMGLISLPIMLRYGYDRRLACGVIAASGTLAQIIPPSLVLIVMADQLGRSVGDMYEAALVPGLMLAGLYALFVFAVTLIRPDAAPGLPVGAIGYREADGGRGLTSLGVLALCCAVGALVLARVLPFDGATSVIAGLGLAVALAFLVALADWWRGASGRPQILSAIARRVVFVMVPPLFLIFLVLGTIFIGLATPTEGGAMGAVGAMALAYARRVIDGDPARFDLALMRHASEATAKLSAFVLFILIGARIFSLAFYGVNGHLWVEHLLVNLPGGRIGFLLFVNLLMFVLAFFLDFFELAFIVVPLLVRPAEALGIDLVWLGVMLGVNIQTSFLHPPFGFALFFLRSVAPEEPFLDRVSGRRLEGVRSADIYWGAVPFVVLQLVMVGLVIAFPQILSRTSPHHPRPAPPIAGEGPAGARVPAGSAAGAASTAGAGAPEMVLPPPTGLAMPVGSPFDPPRAGDRGVGLTLPLAPPPY